MQSNAQMAKKEGEISAPVHSFGFAWLLFYQSTVSLLVIDFKYFEGWDCEIVVEEFAAVDSYINRVSSYVFSRRYVWEKVPIFTARMNQFIDHEGNLNEVDVPYSDLEYELHRQSSSAVAIYCFGFLKTQFICGLFERTVIDITQLECPPIADISLPAIGCTFACHNKSKHVFEFWTVCSLTQWPNFHTLSL